MPAIKFTAPRSLSVEADNGEHFAIHPIWLRERCQDAANLDSRTGQRWHDPSDLPLDLQLTAVTAMSPGRFHVHFSDGHEADFMAVDLLREFLLPPGDHDIPTPQLWDSSLQPLPRATWHEHENQEPQAEWLEAFLRFGFLILEGVPTAPRSILKVARTFGFTRETNFGELFEVRSVPEATDLAYTPVPLDAHTDNPYRDPVPGVQLLHCLANQTTGGLSTLVDGFSVAAALRASDPEAFQVLSHTPVRFRYRDASTDLTASAVPIELDVTGRMRAIHFSPRLDFVPLLPPAQLSAYYRARRLFDHMLRSSKYEIRFLLNPGELVMMDNRRLLHGRTGFNPAEGLRHLQGCYIDIDGPRSGYRVLRQRRARSAA